MPRRHHVVWGVLVVIAIIPVLLGAAGLIGLPLAAFILPGGADRGGFGDALLGVTAAGAGPYVVRGPRLVGSLEASPSPEAKTYTVVVRIPAVAWIPSLVTATSLPFIYAITRRELHGSLVIPFSVAFLFASLSMAVALAILIPPEILEGAELPSVALATLSHDPVGRSVTLTYRTSGTSITGVYSCEVEVAGSTFNCTAVAHPPDTVDVGIPLSAYKLLYNESDDVMSSMILRINVSLDYGWASGSFKLNVLWKNLRFIAGEGRLLIENPNPIPFTLENVTIMYIAEDAGPRLVSTDVLGDMVVPPGSVVSIPVEPCDWAAYVTFRYEYKFSEGGVVEESIRVG